MRDLVVFALFVGLLPTCLLRPWIGVLCFSFLAYNRTQDLTWGFARGLPIAQSVAIAMIVGWMMFEYRPIRFRDIRIQAMVVLLLCVGISIAVNPVNWNIQSRRYTELCKVIFVALLTGTLTIDRRRLRQILMVVAIGFGFYGAKNGLAYFLLGTKTIIGPGGMLKDNNDFALAMVMNLPFLWYLSYDVKDVRIGGMPIGQALKWGMRAVFATTMITIIGTGSRGAFLATGAVVGWMVMKTRFKIPALFGALVLGIIAFNLAPQEYKDRMTSMFKTDVTELDQSAQGRLVSWAVAGNMIQGNPFFGIGFQRMLFEYHHYTEGVEFPPGYNAEMARVAHNSYLQIWAESGSFAYLSFMFMLLSTIFFCWRISRRALGTDDEWVVWYARSIECTLIAFVIGATFLNRAHFDLVYQLVAVATAIPAVMAYERAHRKDGRRRPGVPARHVEVRSQGALLGGPRR